MLTIAIPGSNTLRLTHLVLDYNGTIAEDGLLLAPVAQRIAALAADLEIHVVTADTHGTVAGMLAGLPVRLEIIAAEQQDRAKRDYVQRLDADRCAAIGNGRNDWMMLATAALGIALIGTEGAAAPTIAAADVVCTRIEDALDLLLKPDRLRATLRN